MNSDGNPERPHRFTKKYRLLTLRFGQRDGNLRPAKCYGNARKSGTGAKIEQGGNTSRQRSGTCNGLNEMARQNVIDIAERGEIDARIPANNKRKVGFKAMACLSIKRSLTGFAEQFI